jgi:hypothetical protein
VNKPSALKALAALMREQEKATGELPDTYRATSDGYLDLLFEVMQAHAREEQHFKCKTQNWFTFVINNSEVCIIEASDNDIHSEEFDEQYANP